MKWTICFFILACCSSSSLSQSDDIVETYVEIMPSFPGGTEELYKFIFENVRYPVKARKKGISGRVVLQFVIDKEGTMKDVKIIRNVDPELDREALRVVHLMRDQKKWEPGIKDGKAVSVLFTLPITFKLQ